MVTQTGSASSNSSYPHPGGVIWLSLANRMWIEVLCAPSIHSSSALFPKTLAGCCSQEQPLKIKKDFNDCVLKWIISSKTPSCFHTNSGLLVSRCQDRFRSAGDLLEYGELKTVKAKEWGSKLGQGKTSDHHADLTSVKGMKEKGRWEWG